MALQILREYFARILAEIFLRGTSPPAVSHFCGSRIFPAFVLLAGAGLFVRTLEKLHAVPPGFRIGGVLEVGLFPSQAHSECRSAMAGSANHRNCQ
jgi:hypothetical protein